MRGGVWMLLVGAVTLGVVVLLLYLGRGGASQNTWRPDTTESSRSPTVDAPPPLTTPTATTDAPEVVIAKPTPVTTVEMTPPPVEWQPLLLPPVNIAPVEAVGILKRWGVQIRKEGPSWEVAAGDQSLITPALALYGLIADTVDDQPTPESQFSLSDITANPEENQRLYALQELLASRNTLRRMLPLTLGVKEIDIAVYPPAQVGEGYGVSIRIRHPQAAHLQPQAAEMVKSHVKSLIHPVETITLYDQKNQPIRPGE